jgi:hypothetical protein
LIAQFTRRQGLHHVIAIAICALMLFFAVGSKVAAYHWKELAARSIAATKVWQAEHVVADSEQVGMSVTLQTIVDLVFLLGLCFSVVQLPLERERSDWPPPLENFAVLAMRPPPAI